MMLFLTCLVCLAFLWWAKEIPVHFFVASYAIIYLIKVVYFYLKKELNFCFFVMEVTMMIVASLKVNEHWGFVWCALSILMSLILLSSFLRPTEDTTANAFCTDLLPSNPAGDAKDVAIKITVNSGVYFYHEGNNGYCVIGKEFTGANKKQIYAFLSKLKSVIPDSYFDQSHIKDQLDYLYAFCTRNEKICGLGYKQTCLKFKSEKLKELLINEYTMKGGYWYTLGFVYGNDVIELDFHNFHGSHLDFHKLALDIANAWHIKLRKIEINMN